MRQPDYERDGIRLYHGDCLEILPELEAGSVDAVVTDPVWPNVPDGMFDLSSTPADLFDAAMLWLPVGVRRLAVHLGCNSDPRFLMGVPDAFPFFRVCWLEYVRPGYLGRLLYTSDVAYFFGEPPVVRPGNFVISGYCRLVDSKRERFEHPCQRQPFHAKWICEKWSSEGEVILDPFLGSGTTAVACIRTGRKCIGIEKERKYFDIAIRRVEQAFDDQALFAEVNEPKAEQLTMFTEPSP